MTALLTDFLFDYTLRTVALGAATLGIVSGALGSYAVLRRQSLLGDAISHAALPGIALAFILTGSRAPFVLVLGAAIAGWIATLVIIQIVRYSRIKYDTALGLVLSVFFGFGTVLLTFIQRRPDATQAGLDRFLFGQAATLLASDVVVMALLGATAMICVFLFYKEFKLLSFDPDFGASLGLPIKTLDIFLTTLLVIAIVIGLQTVGVVLMSAMLIAPAAAARQWTNRLSRMMVLAAGFGAAAGLTGAFISSTTPRMPAGPTIVICATILVVASLLFAGNRGMVWRWYRTRRNRAKLRLNAVLCDLYALASQHDDPQHAHDEAVLRAMSAGKWGVEASLRELAERGLVRKTESGKWVLTESGSAQARHVIREHALAPDEQGEV